MDKRLKIACIAAVAVIVLVVLFNLLPGGIRTAATLCAGFGVVAGAIAGWKAKEWYDQMTEV